MTDVSREPLTPAAVLAATPRASVIVGVLRRHGFAPLLKGTHAWPPPEEVRAALEELGSVFVKFGQVLSTRGDLLPPRYIDTLAGLQDRVAQVPLTDVRAVFEADRGIQPEEAFLRFNPTPIAAASMAQVHAAETRDGRPVVVKIQRPDLPARIDEDLRVMGQVAAALDLTVRRLRPFDLPALVADFGRTLHDEADFRREAANMRRFQASLASDPTVWIPGVLDDLSGRCVLTMERSAGLRVEDYVAEHPEAAGALARRLGDLFVRQVFGDGLFHADPHPGNFFILDDRRLCLHDFGMVGELDDRLREALVELVKSTVEGDARSATRAYLDMGLLPAEVDRRSVEADVGELIRDIRSGPLQEVSIGKALEALIRIGGGHRIRQAGTFLLLSRAFVTLEGSMAKLDPELAFIEVFGGAFRQTAERRFSPDRLGRDAVTAAQGLDHLLREAPTDLRRIMGAVADGELGRVVVESGPAARADQAARWGQLRRTVAGGALVIAASILLATGDARRIGLGVALLIIGAWGLRPARVPD